MTHKSSTNTRKTSQNRLKIFTKPKTPQIHTTSPQRDVKLPLLFFLILQVAFERPYYQDKQDEPNSSDEPPQEPQVSIFHLYFMRGIKPGWYICKVLMVPGRFSRMRGAVSWKCGQRNRLLRRSWTTVTWAESQFPVMKFCGVTCCLVGARPRTGRPCSGWSIHPQSISDSDEVRCLHRTQRTLKRQKEPEVTADISSVTVAARLNESNLFYKPGVVNFFKIIFCLIRSVGSVVLLVNRLTL